MLRKVVSSETVRRATVNSAQRSQATGRIRTLRLGQGLAKVDLSLPTSGYPTTRTTSTCTEFLLDTPLQKTLSEFVRCTRMPLPAFVELVRGHTVEDYRPNKNMIPKVIANVCAEYPHLERLQTIVVEGVRVELEGVLPPHPRIPANHGSAVERVNILRKNVRKEQDAWCCLVLDINLLSIWPEIHLSPFGIVDKAGGDPQRTGRTIHDLSSPEGASVNELTDQDCIPRADYQHCDAVATEITRLKREHPGVDVKLMAGDVTTAFRHACIHSRSVHRFAGHIEADNVLVIELAARFGWTGSPGVYTTFGEAIPFVHGHHANAENPTGFFNYHWVDDHVNVAADINENCADMERSLRYAMAAVLGGDAVNEDNFTAWATRQKVLGLEFDTVSATVSMPAAKISNARNLVATAFHAKDLSRKGYRSLLGSLRHVATCIRAARPFLQRLRLRETNFNRFQRVSVSEPMKKDLLWWWKILHSPALNGVSLEFFNGLPVPDIAVEMDACDYDLCALDVAANEALTYQFSPTECRS